MKDKHFYNYVSLFEAMLDSAEQNRTDDETIGHIAAALSVLRKAIANYCDVLTREEHGETKNVELLYDDLDNPAFAILPDEATTVVQRLRAFHRVQRRFDALMDDRSKSFGDSFIDFLAREFFEVEPEEEPADAVGLAEDLKECHERFADEEFDPDEYFSLLPLSVACAIVRHRVNELESESLKSGTELEGDDADEYLNLMLLLDEIKVDATTFGQKHPDAPLGIFFREDEEPGDEDDDENDDE